MVYYKIFKLNFHKMLEYPRHREIHFWGIGGFNKFFSPDCVKMGQKETFELNSDMVSGISLT